MRKISAIFHLALCNKDADFIGSLIVFIITRPQNVHFLQQRFSFLILLHCFQRMDTDTIKL